NNISTLKSVADLIAANLQLITKRDEGILDRLDEARIRAASDKLEVKKYEAPGPPLSRSRESFTTSSLTTPIEERKLTLTDNGTENRYALIIGNSSYQSSPLKNPVNDARGMASVLRSLGFKVTEKENLDLIEMKRAVRTFGEVLGGRDVGLFYFAGHGAQING